MISAPALRYLSGLGFSSWTLIANIMPVSASQMIMRMMSLLAWFWRRKAKAWNFRNQNLIFCQICQQDACRDRPDNGKNLVPGRLLHMEWNPGNSGRGSGRLRKIKIRS